MDLTESNEDLLNSLRGRAIVDWHMGDGGMHLDLDDGKVVIFSGAFVIAVMGAEIEVLH